MMKYDISDLEVIWRKGNGEMPERVKKISDSAGEELLLRSLQLPDDITDAIRDNAHKSNKTIIEYISAIVKTSMQPA